MKKSLLSLFVLSVLFLTTTAFAQVTNTTHGGSYATIQAAINAAMGDGDVITVNGTTYIAHEAIVVNKQVFIEGVTLTPTITPPSGIGITVSANNVTLQNLKVTGATDHGIWADNVSGLVIANVTADLNGTGGGRSGIALRHVTGFSVLTNVTATNNKGHGLEIGNGSMDVQVNGGTFTGNGVDANLSYGGGIMIYADAAQTTTGIRIYGAVNASSNKTAGIYLFCNPSGHIDNTTIGATGSITLDNNGSVGGVGTTGGAAVLLFGPCDQTTITANSTNSGSVNPTAGLVVLGTNASGANSPTNTVTMNCNLSGFTTTSPAATMKVTNGSDTFICTNDVDATGGNKIDGVATGFDVEDKLVHKVDNIALGLFRGPGTELYVTQSSGSIQRAVTIANNPYPVTMIHVQSGTYNETVNVSKSLIIVGEGATRPIVTPPAGSVGINITANGVTIDNLEVTGASGTSGLDLTKHGIWANGVNGLTIQNVNAHNNAGSGIALRRIPASPVSTVKNVIASNNSNQGLEIGNGSNGVVVDGGTFNGNGTITNLSTGGGIMLYSDVSVSHENDVENIVIKGTVASNTNTTAGIYIYSSPGIISGTSIGQASGSNITLTDNGSNPGGAYGAGGAGVLVYGLADQTTVTANFIRSSVNGGGLVVLGTNGSGLNSPDGTSVRNSVFTGYNSSNPAITLETKTSSPDYISNTGVDAFTGNTFTGTTSHTDIENIIYDMNDNPACGTISIPTDVSVTVVKNVEFTLTTYLSFTSSVALNNVNVAVAQLLDAVNTTATGTMVTGVSVEIPSSVGTVSSEVLQINADIPLGGSVELKYKIQDRNNFANTTRVQHFHNGVWTDLGRIIRYDYDALGGGTGSNVNITDVPGDATAIYAVFSTNSTSTFAFVTPLATSTLYYLTPTNAFQSATVNTAYPSSLIVTVTDGGGSPVAGRTVTFTRPSSGASVTFTSGTAGGPDDVTAITNASGIASVTVTANGTTGTFNVTANTANSSAAVTFVLTNNPVTALSVKLKVFLQGPYSSGAMTTTLNTNSLIPLTSNTAFNTTTYSYTAKTVGAIPNANIVDWILVELRTGTAAATKVETQAAFLLKNGSVVDADGSSDVAFSVATTGSYYIVIRHRNHLAIMSAAPVALPNASSVYDFTTAQSQAYGTTPMEDILGDGTVNAMWMGDVNGDGVVMYNRTNNDRLLIYNRIGNAGYNTTVSGYYPEDINMDGVVMYNRTNNDRLLIYNVIGNAGYNTTRSTQVPN